MINITKLSKNKKETNKGITLIALVITIIVLLILAAVSIATLTGENGILTKANTAKNQTQIASAKEQAQVDIADYIAEQVRQGKNADLNDAIIKEILTNKNYVEGTPGENSFISKEGKHEIPYSDLYSGSKKKDTPPIPEGFYHAGGTIEEGFVISDKAGDDLENSKQGNQFVWVPVDNINDFVRTGGYSNGSQQTLSTNYTEPFANGYRIQKGTETITEADDYNAMKKSVEDNHGFYIGRFEAGNSSGNVVVKKGADVYNYVPWGNAMDDIEGTTNTSEKVGAVKLSKEFATNNNYQGVTSTLCYGVQWDATMQFMDSNYITGTCEAKSYVRNSSKQGWYSDNYNSTETGNMETNSNHITGQDLIYSDNLNVIANKQKNIYDMAGNVWEWTMEAFSTSRRVYRGGVYYNDGSSYPASGRSDSGPNDADSGGIGFRVALYL